MMYAKLLAIVAVLATIVVMSYNKGVASNEAKHVEEERNALLAYAAEITKGVEQHDKDQLLINKLAADNKRLRIHLPTKCETTTDSSGTSGAFSARVDEAFAELQAEVGQLFQRCDQLNIDAIQRNTGD